MLAVPVLLGVKTPADVMLPPVADHVTPVLKLPVPLTVAEQALVCDVLIEEGEHETVIEVMVGVAAVTTTLAEPDFVLSCVEVAVMLAVPVPLGVNRPPEVMLPPVADHVTAELKLPVPLTVAEQALVCEVVIDDGRHETVTEVMVDTAAETATFAEPDLVVSCVDLAVMVAVPVPLGVNTPAEVMVPPVADHVTAVLKLPVPLTVAEHALVCAVVIDDGRHETVTEVMVDAAAETATLAEPDLVVSCVEVAVTVAVPVPLGVNTPPEDTVPPVADHVTAVPKLPVPLTVAEQALVCDMVIEVGKHETVTDVMEGTLVGAETTTLVEPDLLLSCVDRAVMIAVPVPLGVNNPAALMAPPVADHVTAELYAPVPETVTEHWLVWPV
jgi:hypothetical protein